MNLFINEDKDESPAVVLKTTQMPRGAVLLHLLTKTNGVLKMSVSPQLQKQAGISCISPLSEISVRYRQTKSDIYKGEDITPIHYHLENRKNFSCLQESIKMLHITYILFPPEKPAGKAFDQLLFFLRCIPISRMPAVIQLCYSLKLLRVEGMLHFPEEENEIIKAPYYIVLKGEFTPSQQLQNHTLCITKTQLQFFLSLARIQKTKELLSLEPENLLLDIGSKIIQEILYE